MSCTNLDILKGFSLQFLLLRCSGINVWVICLWISCVNCSQFESISVLECEAYQLGKHQCSSFSHRVESRQLQLFKLVHTDIWGLSRVKSPKGF